MAGTVLDLKVGDTVVLCQYSGENPEPAVVTRLEPDTPGFTQMDVRFPSGRVVEASIGNEQVNEWVNPTLP